jgi:hypothetical protein
MFDSFGLSTMSESTTELLQVGGFTYAAFFLAAQRASSSPTVSSS